MKHDTEIEHRQAQAAMVVCGALGREVRDIVRRRGWEVDLFGIPADYHLYPDRIVEAVDEKLAELNERYEQIVVVYGDCGTAGALDRVLARYKAVRPVGPHCYAMFAGCSLDQLTGQIPETYFLTDYLVRHWHETVMPAMGLDRRPELKNLCFRGFRRVLYLRQVPETNLEEKAQEIADFLELPLEVWDVGLTGLESRLARVMEGG